MVALEKCQSLWRHDFQKGDVMRTGFSFLNAAINTGYSRMFIIEDRGTHNIREIIHPHHDARKMVEYTKFYRQNFDNSTGDIKTYLPVTRELYFDTEWGNDKASWFFCKPNP